VITEHGIKRRLTFLARKRQDVSGRAKRIRRGDAFVSQRVLACHSVSWVSCQNKLSNGAQLLGSASEHELAPVHGPELCAPLRLSLRLARGDQANSVSDE
jgi:hypothetical protein